MLRTFNIRTAAAIMAAALTLVWTQPSSPASAASAASEYGVSYPAFPVTINETAIDQLHSQYPLLVYNNITYFPMTWSFTSALGLTINWNEQSGLSLNKNRDCSPLLQTRSTQANTGSASTTAISVPFPVKVNGSYLDNSQEAYPVLLYNNITYFPMTWRFTNGEFDWQTSWDDVHGYEIQSCGMPAAIKQVQRDSINLANGGQLAVKDEWIYMNPQRSSGVTHSLIKTKADGSAGTKLSDDNAMSINIEGDWLYYVTSEFSKQNAIYKIQTDGTNRTLVSQTAARTLRVKDGWMYYLKLEEQQNETASSSPVPAGVFRMKTDGSGEQLLLADSEATKLYLYDNRIYFQSIEEGYTKLFVMNLDGTGKKQLREGVTGFIIADDWIYYHSDQKLLGKMSLDGSVDLALYEFEKPQLSSMTYRDGWIYYAYGSTGISGSVPIERMRIDGTGREQIAAARPVALYIAGDEMYFANWVMGDLNMEHFKLEK